MHLCVFGKLPYMSHMAALSICQEISLYQNSKTKDLFFYSFFVLGSALKQKQTLT